MNQPKQVTVVNIIPQCTTENPPLNQPNQDNQSISTLEELVQILELLANSQD